MRRLVLVGCWVLASCVPTPNPLHVFAAASLADVIEDMEPVAGRPLRLTVGASSLLSLQIERGAPADVFLAADPRYVERLTVEGKASRSRAVARGRLVIVGAPGQGLAPSARAALTDVSRIALADPSHVPAGQYAEAALRQSEAWSLARRRVVPVADVRAALVAVQRGAADVAVVYASDALAAPDLDVVYRFAPSESPDIVYMGAVTSDDPDAAAWLNALSAPSRQAVWRVHGFDPPTP